MSDIDDICDRADVMLADATDNEFMDSALGLMAALRDEVRRLRSDLAGEMSLRLSEYTKLHESITQREAEVETAEAERDDLRERAEGAEAVYASIKRKLGQDPGDGRLPHDAVDAINAKFKRIADVVDDRDDCKDAQELYEALKDIAAIISGNP